MLLELDGLRIVVCDRCGSVVRRTWMMSERSAERLRVKKRYCGKCVERKAMRLSEGGGREGD